MKKPEEWKIINGFPNYKISNWGRIISIARIKKMPTGGFQVLPENIMWLGKCKGYNTVKLCKNGKPSTLRVGRLVGLHFVSNPDNLPIINHCDTDKSNDYFENLEWTTESGNMKHAFDNGLLKIPDNNGEKNGRSKLTHLQVEEIKSSIGMSNNELAKKYEVSKVMIGKIINGKSWKN